MAEYVYDDSFLPVVLTHVPLATSIAEAKVYYAWLEEVYRRRRAVTLIRIVIGLNVDKDGQRFAAQWVKSHLELLRERALGTAFISSSPVFRFVLSGLFIIQPLPYAYTVVGNVGDALEWAEDRLTTAGEKLPVGAAEGAKAFFDRTGKPASA